MKINALKFFKKNGKKTLQSSSSSFLTLPFQAITQRHPRIAHPRRRPLNQQEHRLRCLHRPHSHPFVDRHCQHHECSVFWVPLPCHCIVPRFQSFIQMVLIPTEEWLGQTSGLLGSVKGEVREGGFSLSFFFFQILQCMHPMMIFV